MSDTSICCDIPEEHNEITGNPLDMSYRRSDCTLMEEFPNGRMLDDLDLKKHNSRLGTRAISSWQSAPGSTAKS